MSAVGHDIALSITLVSPFLTRGLVPDRASYDAALARDMAGRIVLPDTLVAGVLRGALCALADAAPGDHALGGETRVLAEDLDLLFGAPSRHSDAGDQDGWRVANEPDRGLLQLSDLAIAGDAPEPLPPDRRHYPRVRIDSDMGSALEGHLQFIEAPFAIGAEVRFAGHAFLRAGAIGPERAIALLNRALALVPAIGAIKGAGFGRIAKCKAEPAAAVKADARPVSAGLALDVEYELDRPFLAGGRLASGNLFVGDAVIPGGAIKGALATALSDAGWLGDPAMQDFLSELTIGHAFPRPADRDGEAWRPPSLSLALAGNRLFDRLRAETGSVPEADGSALALAFQPDMKDSGPIARHMGQDWAPPEKFIRTRTAIDPETGSARIEDGAGQLFSHAAVEPQGYRWCGRMIAPSGADPVMLARVIAVLRAGRAGLGKTHARLSLADEPRAHQPPKVGSPPYAVTLMSAAALNNVDALRDGRGAFDDYADYWAKLGYTLIRHFAQQRLEGGYLALRYPPKAGRCEPYLLSEPGSVFLIEPHGGDATVPLDDLLRHGLPPTCWIERPHWRHCPFLPQNGYGQIRIDNVDHAALTDGIEIQEAAA